MNRMKYDHYLIENTNVGYLNNEEKFYSYLDAMEALVKFIKEDKKNEHYPLHELHPNSRWAINGVKKNGDYITVFSVTTKRALM